MCSRAIATRPGVSCPGLGFTLVLGLLGPLVGCGNSSNDDADSPKSTATASSANTGGSSSGGSSATANGTDGESTSGAGGSAGGGGSAGTGGGGSGGGGSGGGGGAGGALDTTGASDTTGAPDTTGASDTGGTGASGTGGVAGDGVACVADGAFCRVAPAPCPEMQVRAVEGSCWGDCVPIGDCTCAGPEDCPDEGQYTCHNFSGRCGPYL